MPKLNIASFIEEAEQVALDAIAAPTGKPIPNVFPRLTNMPYKLAIIGEAPGRDEESQGLPFVGQSGKFLNALLSKAGIARDACFVGNVCQHRPPNNDISLFSREGENIQQGIAQLLIDLETFKPNLCLLLGKTALWAFSGKEDIGNWRGSLFQSNVSGYKCLPSYHPAACLRAYEFTAPLLFDLHKAKAEATTPDLILPIRELEVNLSATDTVLRLLDIHERKPLIAIDIEGGVDHMSCIGIAESATRAFIVPFCKFSVEEELPIWRALCKVLEDPLIPKILQNSLYDRFVLQYAYGIVVRGVQDDTMLRAWEKHCELEKGLGFLCSIYTREPFYKSEHKSDTKDDFHRYCLKDCCTTYEINTAITLTPQQESHYRFNIDCLNPLMFMELTGILYDKKKAKQRLVEITEHIYRLQARLDELAGVGFTLQTPIEDIQSKVKEVLCHKKDPTRPKKGNEEVYEKITEILGRGCGRLSIEELSYINIECGLSMNVKSHAFKTYLYETLKLPIQKNRATKATSTDNEALLTLRKKTQHPAVDLAINIMELRTRAQVLVIKADIDERIRCGFNVVGTKTGRLTSYKSPTGSGFNLQTIPDDYPSLPEGHPLRKGMRDLFLADLGYMMCQCDLKGSDGWTIGAHLASLGASHMLDDLRANIKPAARICFMLRHGNDSLHGKDRIEVKELLKEVKSDDWDYFAMKVGIWGLCYLMGPDLLAAQISEESYGKVNWSREQVSRFKDAVFSEYKITIWHNAMKRKLDKDPTLTSPSGNTRRFFGRKDEILGEALASEPQNTTTYATNLAMLNLWKDDENYTPETSGRLPQTNGLEELATGNQPSTSMRRSFRIQPLHSIHDALLLQFKTEDRTWAANKITTYFANEIIIAGIPITIPFDGKCGSSWGTLNEPLK